MPPHLARRVVVAAILAGGLAPGPGCDANPGATSSAEEATVKGTVRIAGKALTGGTVTFNPANVNRKDAAPRSAAIGPDGSYTIRTLVGGNGVGISGPEVRRYPGMEYEEMTRYVEPGENAFDIDMAPPQTPGARGAPPRR